MFKTKRQQTAALPATTDAGELKTFDPGALPKPPEKQLFESAEAALKACNVTVMSGSSSREFPVAHQKVGDVRKLLKSVLNIADNAVALVNGVESGEDAVLAPNSRVEFVRRAGSKGGVREFVAM
jgi:hypothetical protein